MPIMPNFSSMGNTILDPKNAHAPIWASTREKTCLREFANNKGADEYDQRLCYLLIGKYHIFIATSEISFF